MVWKNIIFSLLFIMTICCLSTLAQAQQGSAEAENLDVPAAPTPESTDDKFHYNPQGFRDPFVSVLAVRESQSAKPEGPAGMKISEISLQGIQIGLGKIAIIKGPDNKAYALKVGELVYDGKLIAIHGNKIIFEKKILDVFGRVKDTQQVELYLHR